MKNTYIYIILFLISNLFAQNNILLTVGDEKISVDDFMLTYQKNKLDSDTLPFHESLNEYLELYIKFKLKVIEAENLGLDTLPSFIRELEGYKRQLVKPYLTDSKISDELLEEAYDRLKQEVSVSHILIQVENNDTLQALNTILAIKKRIDNGEDFSKLAKEFSNDPSVKDNNGSLGYFTALYMVYPFENAAYNTPVGSVSNPVKTRFGYHLVKVNDKRNSRGEVKVSHIMIRVDNNKESSIQSSKKKIYELYDSLKMHEGANFSDLAKQYSDDKQSGSKGGELDWFGTNKMVKNFEEISYSLDSINAFSQPFQTEFGWHIVKLIDKKQLPLFDEMKESLKKKIERDSRSQKTRDVVISRLQDEWGMVENHKAKNIFYNIINEDFFSGADILEKIHNNGHVMFVFNNCENLSERTVFQKDFAEYMITYRNRLSKEINVRELVDQFYNTFKEQRILELETNNLENKYNDFRLLIDEYHDGILLFNLSEEKVWNKAIKDTLGLSQFYEKNKHNYMWPNRFSLKIFSAKDEVIYKKLVRALNRNGFSDDKLLEKLNKNSELNVSVESGIFSYNDNDMIDENLFSMDFSEVKQGDLIKIANTNQVVLILDILPSSVKLLSEIKGIVISDYQVVLEEEWVRDLRLKYDVDLNNDLLSLVKAGQVNTESTSSTFNNKFDCHNFETCFLNVGQFFGYSNTVFFGWNNVIYTTELNPLNGNDK